MTRDEQLFFCRQCTNRKMDPMIGIVCSLTGQQATFQNECADFNHDTTVKISPTTQEDLAAHEVIQTLSVDALQALRTEQNLPMGVTAAVIVGLLGAVLWAAISAATGYQIGYLAVAIGAGVGYALRFFGKGVDPIFGFAGGVIAVLSCFIGNFLSILAFLADSEQLGYMEVLFGFDYSYFFPVMAETFSPMDLLFYGIAGWEGYKFAFRVVEQ